MNAGFTGGLITGAIIGAVAGALMDPMKDKTHREMKKASDGMFKAMGTMFDNVVDNMQK